MNRTDPTFRDAAQRPELTLLTQITAQLAPALEIGETSEGMRRIIPILGGTVTGPYLRGEIIPGGADWNTWHDGARTGSLSAHYAIRTHDGAIVGVTNTGRHGVPTHGDPIYTSPSLEAPPGPYAWLNHVALVGTLRPHGEAGNEVRLQFWWAGTTPAPAEQEANR